MSEDNHIYLLAGALGANEIECDHLRGASHCFCVDLEDVFEGHIREQVFLASEELVACTYHAVGNTDAAVTVVCVVVADFASLSYLQISYSSWSSVVPLKVSVGLHHFDFSYNHPMYCELTGCVEYDLIQQAMTMS